MQEEIEIRAVTLAISASKMSARLLKAAIKRLLDELQKDVAKYEQKRSVPHGKQTVKQLAKQNAGLTNIEITDSNIKSFERVARKYGVDYALKKDSTGLKPKYLVFFKARDADALTVAFKEFTAETVQKERRPSVLSQLRKFTALAKANLLDRVKNKDKELTR